jgi:hypothetical protein
MALMTGESAGTAAAIRPHQSMAHNQGNVRCMMVMGNVLLTGV